MIFLCCWSLIKVEVILGKKFVLVLDKLFMLFNSCADQVVIF